jgi:hypothetical protein
MEKACLKVKTIKKVSGLRLVKENRTLVGASSMGL